jgi:hypothetical protein
MWTCPKCGEKIEDSFDSCWKCAGAVQATKAAGAPKKPLEQFEVLCFVIGAVPSFVLFALGRPQGAADATFRIVTIISAWVMGIAGFVVIKLYQRSKAKGHK